MASTNTQKQAAKQFVQEWSGKGYEKGETQRFWLSLLHNVFGIDDPTRAMEFESPVKTITKEKGSDFIDGYITATKVLIEQKGSKVSLSEKYRQSDGQELTPYQQARRYAAGLPLSLAPRWIVACNFSTFEVHDMEHPNDAPEIIELKDLEKEYTRLSFLVDDTNVHLKKELEVSIQAGEIVGVLYDKILSQYKDPNNPDSQKSLNKLCVRLVFCLYAEDAGIFGTKNMFHDYMEQFPAQQFREQLIKLFRILDQKPEDRDPYEDEKLLAFPYVNGGMFAGDIEIPRINDEIRTLILQRASDDFDWSLISPTIFGAVFESTLNPETRRAGGMHYTSIENIHKVIDPLFLDDLKAELADIKATSVAKAKKDEAIAFQDKLAGLKFFDPACGSGNFLTESYTSLRRLENEALRIIYGGNRVIGEIAEPIKVSINQFFGIEINDFACSVAQTALWIAESQMMQETDEIVGFSLDPLPLKTYTNIHEGNALRMDWNEVVPASELNFIMGNPPFAGKKEASKIQKEELVAVFDKGAKGIGNLDYVCGWYIKAARMIEGTRIRCAFVSTNSISQGEQVPILWKELLKYNVSIDFAHRTFKWSSEASEVALVYCVIIGFSNGCPIPKKCLYQNDKAIECENINPYLVNAPTTLIVSRSKPICDVPQMSYGSMPIDNGNLILSREERDIILSESPELENYVLEYVGGDEIVHCTNRWCLWLKGASPKLIGSSQFVKSRVMATRDFRLSSNRPQTLALADTPTLFGEIRQPETQMIVVPKVTAGTRRYIPLVVMSPSIIVNGSALVIPSNDMYLFGVLHSSVHMAWVRAVCCYYGPSYQYSATGIYNNFPWPKDISEEARTIIQGTGQMIIDARETYPDSNLAELYDEALMPPELRKAHRANDAAVLEAYGFPKDASESDIVARLFKMYQEITS